MKDSDKLQKLMKNRESIREAVRESGRLNDGMPITLVHRDFSSGNDKPFLT